MAQARGGASQAGAGWLLGEGTSPLPHPHLCCSLQFKTPFLKTLRGYLGAQAWRTLETLLQVGTPAVPVWLHLRASSSLPAWQTAGSQRQFPGLAGLALCLSSRSVTDSFFALHQRCLLSLFGSLRLQVSPRTRWLVAHDWVRASVFGRNTSDI